MQNYMIKMLQFYPARYKERSCIKSQNFAWWFAIYYGCEKINIHKDKNRLHYNLML